jgi:hypothetical protein
LERPSQTLGPLCVWARNNQPGVWASNYLKINWIVGPEAGMGTTPNGRSKKVIGRIEAAGAKPGHIAKRAAAA